MQIKKWLQNYLKEISQWAVLFGICVSVAFIFGSTSLSEDNYCYAVEEIHAFDNSIYQNNISTVGADYSPKLYANLFMAAIMKIFHIEWGTAAMVLIRLNYILYAVAATLFAKRAFEGRKRLFGALLVSLCCFCQMLVSLAFTMNGAADVFYGTAIPLALIGLVFAITKPSNWDAVWIFMTLAELMHVHEGFWAGCIAGIIWIAGCIVDKIIHWKQVRMLPMFVISVLLVVLPSLTHAEAVDNDLFTEIYVHIRTPHHLLVSTWGWEKILVSALMIVGALYVLYVNFKRKRTEQLKKNLLAFLLLTFLWGMLLVVEYLSTEILSVSLIVTLYVPKLFKYVTWLGMLIYVYFGMEGIENGKYIQGFGLLGVLLVPYNSNRTYILYGIFFLLFFFFERYCLDEKIFKTGDKYENIIQLEWIVILTGISYAWTKTIRIIPTMLLIMFLCFVFPKIKLKKLANFTVAFGVAASILGASFGFLILKDEAGIRWRTSEEFIKDSMGEDTYNLALEFQAISDKDSMFLADPDSAMSNGFQLVSQRSCYAIYKNTPTSKKCVIEWYRRIENVRKMKNCSANELSDLLQEINIKYVLITADRFEEVEESGLFRRIVRNDTLGMYYLK